jgi:DnaK suppressor protein
MAVKKTKTSKNPGASAKKTTVRKKGPAAKKPPIKQKAARPAKSSAKKTVSVKTTAGKKITATRKKVEKMPEKKRDRLLDVKKALLTRREAIVKEAKAEIAKYMSGENRQLVDTALDEGDWAVVDISEDISEVLRKIGEGSYGICEECGEEISEKRLKVIPTAALCINCQGTKEQLEAVERQEEV